MSLQCEALQNECGSRSSLIPSWLKANLATFNEFYSNWKYHRHIKRSRRALEALPEHILHDIGWPCVDDRVPAPMLKAERR
ncbi:DUF1127 domain-containing protein [Brucella sp. H1_1004]|uniref:DUF1127 domain-containing protein n=1 Tax=Brucella sp. H1_1004 TaxID=3110109 RepID=UPI0039B55452